MKVPIFWLYTFLINNVTFYILDNTTKYLQPVTTISPAVEEFYNCEILACPEFSNFATIVNDTRYDYYSLYTNPIR